MFDSPRYHPSLCPAPHLAVVLLGTRERDVEIGGSFDGTFDGRSIKVLKGASVTGELGAEIIEVYGYVRGKIRAATVVVRPTGVVEGELEYETLAVDPGATINARCVAPA